MRHSWQDVLGTFRIRIYTELLVAYDDDEFEFECRSPSSKPDRKFAGFNAFCFVHGLCEDDELVIDFISNGWYDEDGERKGEGDDERWFVDCRIESTRHPSFWPITVPERFGRGAFARYLSKIMNIELDTG